MFSNERVYRQAFLTTKDVNEGMSPVFSISGMLLYDVLVTQSRMRGVYRSKDLMLPPTGQQPQPDRIMLIRLQVLTRNAQLIKNNSSKPACR